MSTRMPVMPCARRKAVTCCGGTSFSSASAAVLSLSLTAAASSWRTVNVIRSPWKCAPMDGTAEPPTTSARVSVTVCSIDSLPLSICANTAAATGALNTLIIG